MPKEPSKVSEWRECVKLNGDANSAVLKASEQPLPTSPYYFVISNAIQVRGNQSEQKSCMKC